MLSRITHCRTAHICFSVCCRTINKKRVCGWWCLWLSTVREDASTVEETYSISARVCTLCLSPSAVVLLRRSHRRGEEEGRREQGHTTHPDHVARYCGVIWGRRRLHIVACALRQGSTGVDSHPPATASDMPATYDNHATHVGGNGKKMRRAKRASLTLRGPMVSHTDGLDRVCDHAHASCLARHAC